MYIHYINTYALIISNILSSYEPKNPFHCCQALSLDHFIPTTRKSVVISSSRH